MNWTEVESHPKLSALEAGVRNFWKKSKTFEKSIEQRAIDNAFTFYDGPPFATGLPHYGHLLQGYMKDSIPRYWTMRGKHIERRFGWDCHGLPIENIVEKGLKISSKTEIEALGVAKFCELCESKVMTYAEDWKEYIERAGRWIDMKNDYKTMDVDYMESTWWAFKQLWNKGLIYEGKKSIWACPRCATPLAQIDVNDQAVHIETEDPSIIVKFRAEKLSFSIVENSKYVDRTFLLAWTTTPWTVPADVLLGINPKEKYIAFEHNGELLLCAEKRLVNICELLKEKAPKPLATFPGKKLLGTTYYPIFDHMDISEGIKFKVVAADFVSMEEGTGIVHIAPAFGEDDFLLGQKLKAGIIQHLTLDGHFTAPEEVKDKYLWDKVAEIELLNQIKEKNALLYNGRAKHVYPECWRCHTKLFTYAMKAWFVSTTSIKERLYSTLERTYWIPEYARTGRLGDWMKNLQDWCISRNRYWGTPLPIWRCDKCGELEVIGSIEELQKISGDKVTDLHRNHVDQLTWKCGKPECQGEVKRIEEVLDCWFDSGSMPYGILHYPFENKAKFEANFPADFVGEGIEHATKWFYSTLVISVGIFDRAPYKNVVNTGIILAEDGRKMSKSLNNYPDPLKLFDETSSDALRFFLFNSPVVKGEFMRFSEKGVREVVNNLLYLYWNTFKYFVTYAEIHNWKPTFPMERPLDKLEQMLMEKPKPNYLDRWIVARTLDVIKDVNEAFEKYDLSAVVKPIQPFVFDLSTWYVRRNRDRFAKGDKAAFETLYWVLYQFTKAVAPILPFTAEAVWQGLVVPWKPEFESVHLKMFSVIDTAKLSRMQSTQEEWAKVEKQVEITRAFCALGHKLRDQNKLPVRQPLGKALLFHPQFEKNPALEDSIKEELNVKTLEYGLDLPKEGKWVAVDEKNADGTAKIKVALDTAMTPELEAEGLKREVLRAIQDARKKAGLKVGDQASIKLTIPKQDLELLTKYQYIEEIEKHSGSSLVIKIGTEIVAIV